MSHNAVVGVGECSWSGHHFVHMYEGLSCELTTENQSLTSPYWPHLEAATARRHKAKTEPTDVCRSEREYKIYIHMSVKCPHSCQQMY